MVEVETSRPTGEEAGAKETAVARAQHFLDHNQSNLRQGRTGHTQSLLRHHRNQHQKPSDRCLCIVSLHHRSEAIP